MLPEYRHQPPVRVVQLLSDAELGAVQAVWRRCTDCPSVSAKTALAVEAPAPRPVPVASRPAQAVVPPTTVLPSGIELRFAFKSASLGSPEQLALHNWAAGWGSNPAAQIRITAYAEETRASRRLCEDRTQAVQSALQQLGIPFSQFERRVDVVADPARRVAIEVTQLPGSTAADPEADSSPPEEAVTRPASEGFLIARPLLATGVLP